MKLLNKKLRLGVALGMAAVFAPITAFGGVSGHVASAHVMTPVIAQGPQAEPASATADGAGYGLFTCQVGLAPVTCYDPYQMRRAYGIDKLIAQGYDGTGSTIVIVDAFGSPFLANDLQYFDNFYGLPAANLTVVRPDGTVPFTGSADQIGWTGEIALDVEWAHAMAPGAKIVLDVSKSDQDNDILSATKYAVDNRLGDVISQSFGENETCMDSSLMAQQHQIFANATAKHITLFASSGDQGASQMTCDGNSWTQIASTPAVDPLVTAVGGTELHAASYCLKSLNCDPTQNPAFGTYQGEIAWNEFDASASTGGGYSRVFGEPPYQQSTIPGGNQRAVPDVAYNAAVYHGALTRWQGHTYLFGGTSAGSPQWSAITAIADQKAGHPLGFLNKALYDLGKRPGYNGLFHDITSGTNSVVELDANNNPVSVSGYNAGTGWDATTGLGSPHADTLVDSLIASVKPGDTQSAISTTKYGASTGHVGHVSPH